jgi:beta-phosphoglucomutase-like phosphatase (HAD superfamily)
MAPRPQAIIFDLSSVLTVSTVLTVTSYHVARDFGIPWEPAIDAKVRGQSFDAIAALLGGRINMPEDELPRLEATLRNEFRDRVVTHPLFLQSGVESLLLQISIADLPIGVVSTLPADDVDLCLQRVGLQRPEIQTVQCGHRGCPAEASPDLHRAAIADLKTDPSTTVAIDHTIVGVESAKAAGVFVATDPTVRTKLGTADMITSYNERYLLDRLFHDAGSLQHV